MDGKEVKLIIGFIIYGKEIYKYLPYFLDSLKKQAYKDYKILAVDNSDMEDKDNESFDFIKKNYLEIKIEQAGKNLGFARAHNRIISQVMAAGAKYYLSLNSDMILEPDAIEKMVQAMEADGALGSASPKIFKWGFPNNRKTKIIDTCGIVLQPGLRFEDLGQEQKDDGRFDKAEILGPSGAAAMYRLSALEKVKTSPQPSPCRGEGEKSEYFDELIFMYKEDCDLAYRLFLSGYKSKFVSEAVVYHDRTISAKGNNNWQIALNRLNKSKQAKNWAFLNQHIIFIKYWKPQNFKNKLAIIWYALKMFLFVLIFEQYLLGQYVKLYKLRKRIIKY
ncbi:hypothetical protein COS18_04690 [Candidatus Falkowbacteria bacterium CG02_land_8_20_14_3_00_36_14]|uniref:Glycosyltransferase 2-like domain-containing protein n=1 Tax=Candidatus Falkowbacteria bacterium CG02_land_8_20_14_3_00_36_14 TaxID=1974560 RepID=A0A2M7DLL2_9BACT|nr:MAG: hypothetical protein COS18_04690 [Candidatus Falkowbacteria bacterium CG02_land_8_20_14_3_00_36_14]